MLANTGRCSVEAFFSSRPGRAGYLQIRIMVAYINLAIVSKSSAFTKDSIGERHVQEETSLSEGSDKFAKKEIQYQHITSCSSNK